MTEIERSDRMNDNRIAEIQQRCEAATPSPWEVEKYYHDEPYEQFIKSAAVVSTYEDGSKRTITRNNWSNPVVADLEFIAHAREDIPYLLAQLAERDKEIERLRKEVASLGYRFPPRRRKEQSMTEIEQAIKYWEKFKQESVEMIAKGKDRNDILAKQVPMCDIALVALREQAYGSPELKEVQENEMFCR